MARKSSAVSSKGSSIRCRLHRPRIRPAITTTTAQSMPPITPSGEITWEKRFRFWVKTRWPRLQDWSTKKTTRFGRRTTVGPPAPAICECTQQADRCRRCPNQRRIGSSLALLVVGAFATRCRHRSAIGVVLPAQCLVVVLVALVDPEPVRAQLVTYEFAGVINDSDTNLVDVGQPFSGTLTYDLALQRQRLRPQRWSIWKWPIEVWRPSSACHRSLLVHGSIGVLRESSAGGLDRPQ